MVLGILRAFLGFCLMGVIIVVDEECDEEDVRFVPPTIEWYRVCVRFNFIGEEDPRVDFLA